MAESWRRTPTESPVTFEIDTSASIPPFEQIKAQAIAQITSGELLAGTKLATVRQLASDLSIAPNTVARAYRELEADGFLHSRGRNGTVVKAQPGDAAALLQLEAKAYASRATELGISDDEALRFITIALKK
ncbi:GntR family transcriptional regulator [Salinibacterium amurskyense]|uniref:GntR family transcriptional regulator n=1 Tax=Salinibacterium amurskyense TaxID=205941 RepID=UPI00311E29A6